MNPVGCFLVPSQPSRAISQSSLDLPDTIRRLEQEIGPALGSVFSKIARYMALFIASPLATILDSGPFRRGQPFLDKGSLLRFTEPVKGILPVVKPHWSYTAIALASLIPSPGRYQNWYALDPLSGTRCEQAFQRGPKKRSRRLTRGRFDP